MVTMPSKAHQMKVTSVICKPKQWPAIEELLNVHTTANDLAVKMCMFLVQGCEFVKSITFDALRVNPSFLDVRLTISSTSFKMNLPTDRWSQIFKCWWTVYTLKLGQEFFGSCAWFGVLAGNETSSQVQLQVLFVCAGDWVVEREWVLGMVPRVFFGGISLSLLLLHANIAIQALLWW
jgi:hypothetical protein